MNAVVSHEPHRGNDEPSRPDLIPREFVRVLIAWSVIPAYVGAGALFGWLADRWLQSYPWGLGAGLLVGLVLAVIDLLRLREEFGLRGNRDE